MHVHSTSRFGIFNPRLIAGLVFCSLALWLAFLSSGSSAITAPLVDPPTCIPPGTLIISDPAGDQTGGPSANQQFDIQSVSIAEPCFAGGENKLVFTIKVANLNSIPANGHWKVRFVAPPVPPATTGDTYFVEMTSDQNSNVSYGYGTITTTSTTLGTADAGSNNADGTISITIANSKVGNPAPGQAITAIQGQTQLLVGAAGTGLLAGMDSTTVTGTNPSYTLVGHGGCTCPAATPTPAPRPIAGAGTPRFQNYVPPATGSFNGGEPSIGSDWLTGK